MCAHRAYGDSMRKYATLLGLGANLRKLSGQAKICTPPGGAMVAKICKLLEYPNVRGENSVLVFTINVRTPAVKYTVRSAMHSVALSHENNVNMSQKHLVNVGTQS